MEETFLTPKPQPGDGAWLLQHGRRRHTPRTKVQSFLRPNPGVGPNGNEYRAQGMEAHLNGTFLRTSVFDVRSRIKDQGPLTSRRDSFLQSDLIGKERTSPGYSPTITSEFLLSLDGQEKLCSIQPQTALQQREERPDSVHESNHNSGPSVTEGMAAVTRSKSLAPHLRKKNNPPILTDPAQKPVSNEGLPTVAESEPVRNRNDTPPVEVEPKVPKGDIRQKLAKEHGVNVSDPQPVKPALVSYPSSNEEHPSHQHPSFTADLPGGEPTRGSFSIRRARGGRGGRLLHSSGLAKAPHSRSNEQHGYPQNDSTKPNQTENQTERPISSSKRGSPAAFRGHGARGRPQPRESRWPTAAETRPDPKRWDIQWDSDERSFSSVDSVCANAGFGDEKKTKKKVEDGIDPDTGFKLTDWSGNWAPAPVDWDSRPAFRDGQSVQKIEQWLSGIEEEMQRATGEKSWAISTEDVTIDGTTYYFAPDPEKPDLQIMGDLAPRYWIPVVFGHKSDRTVPQAPQIFWNELLKSNMPTPYDEDDLIGAKPWWEKYETAGKDFLQHYDPPSIKAVDPDENENERIAREHDHGSHYHTENRKRTEKAKKEAQRARRKKAQEKAYKISQVSIAGQNQEKITPGIKLYLRSAKPEDIPRIREIYNYYVDFSVCTPETVRRTNEDMEHRLKGVRRNLLPFLVACERGGKIPARRKKDKSEELILPDKVVGFAMADDYNDMQGMYRFTAEIEVFTDQHYYMKGVSKCLLDKLMGLLDPQYIEKGGYEVVGEDLDGSGPQRRISNLMVHLPYDKSKPDRLEWIGKWLNSWLGFEKVGDLQGIGLKESKSVSLAIFQRKTGEEINPALPPVMMNYPK